MVIEWREREHVVVDHATFAGSKDALGIMGLQPVEIIWHLDDEECGELMELLISYWDLDNMYFMVDDYRVYFCIDDIYFMTGLF